MTSATFFLACMLFVTIFNHGSALTCEGMEDTEMYEDVFGTEMMGCYLTPKQAMVAAGRMHWVVPSGEHIAEISGGGGALDSMSGMVKSKEMKMTKMGLKVASVSTSQSGTLKMNPACVTAMPPDMVAMMMAEAGSPKEFNGMVKKECSKTSVRLIATERFSEDQQEQVNLLACLLGVILSFLTPGLTAPTLALLKQITNAAVVALPCPSDMARFVKDVASTVA